MTDNLHRQLKHGSYIGELKQLKQQLRCCVWELCSNTHCEAGKTFSAQIRLKVEGPVTKIDPQPANFLLLLKCEPQLRARQIEAKAVGSCLSLCRCCRPVHLQQIYNLFKRYKSHWL